MAASGDDNMEDLGNQLPVGKKERGIAKGAITRLLKNIEKLPKDKTYLTEIKEKISSLPVAVQKFEEVHLMYMATLNDEAAKEEAVAFRQEVLGEAEAFEQSFRLWIAGEEEAQEEQAEEDDDKGIYDEDTEAYGEPVNSPGLAALEDKTHKLMQELDDIERTKQLEERAHELQLEAERARHELHLQRSQNAIMLQRERKSQLEQQQRLDEELKLLELEYVNTEAGGVGPTLNLNPTSTPGHTEGRGATHAIPVRSAPESRPVKESRLSWEPSRIASEEENDSKVMKTIIAGLFSEVMNESRVQQQAIVDTLQLPRRELQTFEGNPLKYWPFIRAFRTNVDNKNIDDASKLSCLLQYCKGQARRILECTEMMEPEAGYKRALEILNTRYGDSFEITQMWIARITDRPNVKGPSDLRDFADDLQCCQEMLKNMSHLGDLDNPHGMRIIWQKLPQYLQDRWSHRNYEIKKQRKRKTGLLDLVEFVAAAAEEATDPIFSRASFVEPKKGKETSNKITGNRPTGSFSTEASQNEVKSVVPEGKQRTSVGCPCCGQGHYITQCQQFKGMRIKDRWELVMKKGLCVNCYAHGHIGRDCPRSFICPIDGCDMKHSKFLHLPTRPRISNADTPADSATQITPDKMLVSEPVHQNTHFIRARDGKLAMPIVPARVWRPDSNLYVDTYALLDPGSDGTYCTKALSDKLEAQGTLHSMNISTIMNDKMPVTTTLVTLNVSNVEETGDMKYNIVAHVRPRLNINLSGLSTQLELDKWPHLRDLDMPQLNVDEVQLLIGQDSSDLLAPEETRRGRPGEPFANLTPLGWAINGPVNPFGECVHTSHFLQTSSPLEKDLRRLWEIEGAHTEEMGWSIGDHKAIEIWNRSLTVEKGHYTMDIPFKAEKPGFPDNQPMAQKRLQSLAKRLDKDIELKKKYTAEMHKLMEKGYAEVVSDEDLRRHDGKVWYLPHHPVLNPKKPEKCRIVFDCAAKYGGSSLNDHIHQGPDLANRLVGVLLRFRQGTVGFMADIEAMFHQVYVTLKDRDLLRFLWFEKDDTLQPLKTFRMTAHLFGGVWSPSCANYALQQVAEEYHGSYPEEVINTVLHNFYVDDCLRSVDTVEAAIPMALGVKELLANRGFHLTKFISSSSELLKHIPREDWGKSLTTLDLNLEDLPTERALGMLWSVESDCLGFDVRMEEKQKTKRGVLSTLSTVYDPLGYVSPYILQARRIFQQLCRLQKGWDEPLPTELEDQWGRWLADLPAIKEFRVPRCIKPTCTPIKKAQLHHFADASEYGYGSASYLRVTLNDDSVHVNLIMAKSRLAPLKGSTIPRLELAGALEAVRLDKILSEELEIPLDTSVYWVDSQIVLWYLNSSDKRFQTYVANRVAKILEHTEPRQWRYVPTEENPGDDSSRGSSAPDLLKNDRWVHGPEFLKYEEYRWPTQQPFQCSELEEQLELKATPKIYATKTEADHTGTLMNYYSSWFKLKKAVVWYKRFEQFLLKRNRQSTPVSVSELQEAERDILLYVQSTLSREESQLKKLNPMKTSDGLLRVGGRLERSQLRDDVKHPVILPYGHHVSRLIIQYNHHITGHAGVERVLAETRRRYWILRGRKFVKSVVYHCIPCKKTRGKTGVQQMADLPESRVTPYEPSFSRVGVDYFGPFMVKRGRSAVKRYGCVFTCFATRAIHIEVAHSLDTDSFIHALERCIARRGEPKEIWSDNGTNFVGAQRELQRAVQEWNQEKIHTHLLKKEIDWHFNPPAASHMGGVWERQIRTIRSVLASVVTQQTLDDEALVTLLTVVEGIINSRPITKLSDDSRDASPLTPNHLLMLRSGPSLPPGQFVDRDQYRKRWKQIQYLADVFWHRWIKEYLPGLQERQKWLTPQRNLSVGDIVLVKQESTPRNQWPLGLVVNTHKGSDDLVRSVNVRTATGIYERPVTKICLLECATADSGVTCTPAGCDEL